MKTSRTVSLFLIGAALWGCASKAPGEGAALEQLSIVWTLLANTAQGECVAEFAFVNRGKAAVRQGDWALYFNQNTLRMAAPTPDSSKGRVEHVNGDLYRFVPGQAFVAPPGDTLRIRYRYEGMLIKERDAPAGAYFVLEKGEKDAIFLPKSFTNTPFSDLMALAPDPALLATIPTAAREYARNLAIPSLPLPQVGKIIPTPFRLTEGQGSVALDEKTLVTYAEGLENEAQYLVEALKKGFGIALKTAASAKTAPGTIALRLAPTSANGVSAEAYHLQASPETGIRISGTDAAGVFYGAQSLLSLLWADNPGRTGGRLSLCTVDILDAPRFAYRGFLLDVSRNFQKKEDVLRLIDLLALYKINKLNLRITEDEGWRIEIQGLPELTQVGGKRGHTRNSKDHLPPSFGSGPWPDAEQNYGTGYYTREDFKEILRYAARRHVQVIPEVCFPSHARAAIKAMEARYDRYMAQNQPQKAEEFRLIDPDDQSVYLSAQLYKDNIACVARPSVYRFYETVVQDFARMYEEAGLNMTLFNTGGDEVPAGAWAKSPLCAQLLKTRPDIKDPRQLQGYFFEKILPILEKHKLQVSGWEEIVLNKDQKGQVGINPAFVGKNVLPLVWDNTGDNIDLGYRIANAGYPVVLCNVTNLYFDLAYNTDPSEPGLYWGGFQDAIDPYLMAPYDVYKTAHFDAFGNLPDSESAYPGKQRLQPEHRGRIVGMQAQLWSETIKGAAMMEYYVVPKLFAFAEKAWAPAPAWEDEPDIARRNAAIRQGWGELANRIGQRELPRLDRFFGSYAYRIAPPGAVLEKGWLKANTAFPGLTIRYTTDGSVPQTDSPAYRAPVQVSGTVQVRAFDQQGRGSKAFTVGE
jgi:hexosaminidase